MQSVSSSRGRSIPIAAAAMFVIGLFPPAALFAHDEIEVGQDGTAAHRLLLHGDADLLSGAEATDLLLEVGGPLDGYFQHDGPGYASVSADEPGEGLFRLLAGHGVSLVRVGFDPGFVMLDPATFDPILTTDGASVLLGNGGDFNRLFIYAMLPGTPIGTELTARFRLRDSAGLHADSEDFTLRFAAVPEPTAAVMAALVGLVATRRR